MEQKTYLVMVIAFADGERGYLIVNSNKEAQTIARQHKLFNWHTKRMAADRAKDLAWESAADERLGLV